MGNLTPSTYEQALAYLTINSSFTGDLGLFHGRMGIILFFAHYARATQSKHYEDFAGYLLDELYEEIHEDLPVNLENGLCGIGWGIEYLVQQGFMEGDTDEILADIDRKVMEHDPLRMTNLSFRRGLAGIAFYVIARLNAHRETTTLPFDDAYLISLQQALECAEFTEAAESPVDLPVAFNQVLKGEKLMFSLPDYLTHSKLSLDKPFDEILLGLEEGLAGWLWSNLDPVAVRTNRLPKADKCIFLFDEESRSTKYGIGTYVNQLTDALQDTEWQVVRIHLSSIQKDPILIEKKNSNFYITIIKSKKQGSSKNIQEQKNNYYRNIFFAIYNYLNTKKISILHINNMEMYALSSLVKYYFKAHRLIITVHYTGWSFSLLGNRNKLQDILKDPSKREYKFIYEKFESEKNLLNCCDQVIAIAQHSYQDIINLYQVPQEKVFLIPHGLQDAYYALSNQEKIQQRKKFGFTANEQLVLFAGRIDPVKGVDYLAKAFMLLEKKYPMLRLIIVGDGDFNSIFTLFHFAWSKVTWCGFIDKKTLYELYSISDIGILPSLHEEFGFVALEMMMMKLPLIATKTTGLKELIKDKESGILIDLCNVDEHKNVESLAEGVNFLLLNSDKRKAYAEHARDIYEEKFKIQIFRKCMQKFYSLK